MEHMRRGAFEVVLRAVGFGALAIFCVMFGMSYAPKAAFQAGGFLTLLMSLRLYQSSETAKSADSQNGSSARRPVAHTAPTRATSAETLIAA